MSEPSVTAPTAAPLACDCLVIGSGAGGALTASYLARRGKDVLLVEEGPDPDELHSDGSVVGTMPFLWREGGIVPVLSNVKLAFGEGRCLGGSTVINSGLIHRTPEAIVDRWKREFGVRDLDARALEGHHEQVERAMFVRTLDESGNPLTRLLEEGARRCSFRGRPTPVAASTGNGGLRKNDARRIFVADAFRRGARIVTRCSATRIRWKGATAEAVDACVRDVAGATRRIRIRCRSLFVCAGPIQSALLLRRSGVTRNVGDSLHLHPTLRVVAEFDRPVDAHAFPMSTFQVDEFAPAIIMGASVTTPAYVAASLSGSWAENRRRLADLRSMASFYVSAASDANGKVRDLPLLPSSYTVRYRVDERALRDLSLGFARLADVLFAAGARRLYPAVEGLPPVTDPAGAAALANAVLPAARLNLMAVHGYSSCRMGEDTSRCAVDSHGRLRGARNVFVGDASVLPSSPCVNPQGPIMALVLRNLEASFG